MPSAHRQEQGRGRQAATFTAQQQLREPQELEALNSLLHLFVLHVFFRQLSFFIGGSRSGSVAAGGGSLGSESRCCLSSFFLPDHSLCFLHLWVVAKFCLCPRLLLISLV
jgi:hypothetical protein